MIDKKSILNRVDELREEIIQIRREFHRIPELGFEEIKTSAKIAAFLEKSGIDVVRNVAMTGIIGLLTGKLKAPVILYRADIDALPIKEKNDVPYRSEHEGKMHACGHDGHIAMALVAAKILAEVRENLNGTVKFIFQPAEETVDGAKKMIREGALKNPEPEICFGMHLWNRLEIGKVVAQAGPMMAASNKLDIKISGKLSHGAMPENGADSIVAASALIQQIQTIVSRRLDPREKAVISIGKIHGGQARNTIGGEIELNGTIRTFSRQVEKMITDEMRKIVSGIEQSFGVEIEIINEQTSPAVINDEKATERMKKTAAEIVGKENIVPYTPQMGSEDMSEFLNRVPGCFIFIGSKNEQKGLNAPHHNPHFNFDEESLVIGTKVAVSFILDYFGVF